MLNTDLRKRLNEWSRWDQLRKLGTSPLVRSSLAFAAAGYLLLWNDKFQDFLTTKFDAHSHYSLWRIWMVYYGGICLAVATGLYSWRCPKPIKDHETAFALAQSEAQYLLVMGTGPKYLADVEALESRCSAAERALWPPDRPRSESFSQERLFGRSDAPEIWGSLIVYAWRLHNIRHPRLRLVILVLYWLGFALLAIPAVWTFVQVSIFALRTLFAAA
jgi:hypothetical protein